MKEEWTKQLQSGDAQALEAIIDRYTGYVYTIVRNFSRGKLTPEDMEEITSDVFLRLWQSRARLQEDAPLSPYLAAIARNGIKNRFRAMGKNPPVRQSFEDLTLADSKDLCAEAEHMEMISGLYASLNQLPHPEQEIVIRFYFYGEKTSEIAKALHLTDAAVRVRLHRSRGKLRNMMIAGGYQYAEA